MQIDGNAADKPGTATRRHGPSGESSHGGANLLSVHLKQYYGELIGLSRAIVLGRESSKAQKVVS